MALTYKEFLRELAKPVKRRDESEDWCEAMGREIEDHPIVHPRYRRVPRPEQPAGSTKEERKDG